MIGIANPRPSAELAFRGIDTDNLSGTVDQRTAAVPELMEASRLKKPLHRIGAFTVRRSNRPVETADNTLGYASFKITSQRISDSDSISPI